MKKFISYSSDKYSRILRLFGLNLVYGQHGNVSRPTIHLETADTVNYGILTVRFSYHNETKFYFRRSGRIDWNCPWIARKFGNRIECDFGDVFTYQGILGNHMDC